ncbi:hypothetical protein [Luteolibacter sp. Populi]|uniref:hypothetical protein n=1 Tax=Luteolibacter sp. Populi TaxID=3230487 RepID=UPI0034654AAE
MMNRRELETQLQAFFDGSLEEADLHALQQKLRADPEARECYRDYLLLHHSLSFRAKPPVALPVIPAPPASRLLRFPRRGLLAAAAVLILSAVAGILAWNNSRRPPLSFATSPGTDISVTREFSTRQPLQGPYLEPGSRLEIGPGTMELRFTSGVRGIVRGPADLTLFSKDLLQMERGTAWFQVPAQAAGFTVSTPDLVLNEVGAEFGIVSDPAFLSEVHVFDGKIEVTNRHGRKFSKWVEAGTAQAAADNGGWQEIPAQRDRFFTSLPGVEPESNVIVSRENSMLREAYAAEASADDLLTGILPVTSGWNRDNDAGPLELTDGIHGAAFEQIPGDKVQGAWTTVGATAEYQLGSGPNGNGYNITMIRSIADWENVGFGNQAWTMEVKPVGGDWKRLVAEAYGPLNAQPLTGGGASKVTVTGKNGRLAQGIEAIKITAGRVPGSVGHAFVWREFDVFGAPTESPAAKDLPPP